MKAGRLAKRSQASSALVITLLGIVLLTILVIGFMQTMSLSLTTAKSYADIQRATLAAQAGLDTAIAQISLATGTNLAFVTGQTNFPSAAAVTVIGAGNLTNLDQMMPLVSGPIAYLTNFGDPGFSNNFSTYASPLVSDNAAQTVDVNVQPYQFIQTTNNVNMYRATWVTMTNTVGSKPSYTRFAYVVLDDTARINPALMTGTGTGMTNSTNWYTGPQDINATYLTNGTDQALAASQLEQLTNSATSNAFAYSDATLGETFSNRTNYEAVKHLFTSSTNPSFDVIPAWYPSGGQPKYNINDLATNPVYGATGMARASNIANIIMSNLTNFYQRDPALTAFGNTNLYVNRLAANIVDYVNPDYPNNVFYNTDYTYSTNTTGISPQGHGIYPILIFEQLFIAGPGAGDGTGTPYKTSKVVTTFWLSCWNPYTTPVQVQSASLHVSSRPGYVLGTAPTNAIPDYTNSLYVISGANGTQVKSLPYTVQPNEFVVLGFGPQTNTITTTGAATSIAPVSLTESLSTNVATGSPVPSTLEQYALNINGQTTAQSGANASFNGPGMSGGLTYFGQGSLSTNSIWIDNAIEVYGSEVADPRWASYFNNVWFSKGSQQDSYANASYWKGASGGGGSRYWDAVFPAPGPRGASGVPLVMSMWANRDNIARSPFSAGSVSTSPNATPDTLGDAYTPSTDSNAAPDVIRNGPMVSIGELGHIFDPASANDALTSVSPRTDDSEFTNNFTTGGARSLRIGRPEENGNLTTNGAAIGAGGALASNWDVVGERAISLLDLFTVNNANTNAAGVTNTITQNMNYGGALGRINPNTASSNVLAAVLSQIQIASDPGMLNSGGTFTGPLVLTNIPSMVNQLMTNRPYSSLSDLYKAMPMFDTNINYYPNPTVSPYYSFNDGNFAENSMDNHGLDPYLIYPATLNVFNRVHQEAFGKLVQHLTVQSRSYRIYVIGQVLDNNQNPHGSIVMEAGVYLQYNPEEPPALPKYTPVIQYVHLLNN